MLNSHDNETVTAATAEASHEPSEGSEVGHFYLIQVAPQKHLGRYQVGFTYDLAKTLQWLQPDSPGYLFRAWGCTRDCVGLATKYATAKSDLLVDGDYFATHPRDKFFEGGPGDDNDLLGVEARCEHFFSTLSDCDGELESIGTIAPDILKEANDQPD